MFRKYFLPFLIVVALCALGGELLLRILASARALPVAEGLKYTMELRATPKPDEPYPGLNPLKKVSIMGAEIRTNERGLRGGPLTTKTGQRIFVLGSSVAMGWGLREEDTISVRLAAKLSDALKTPVDSVNGGVANSFSKTHLALLRKHFDSVSPDLVVLVYYLSDVAPINDTPVRGLIGHSLLFAHLYAWAAKAPFLLPGQGATLKDHFARMYAADSDAWKKTQEDLRAMKDFCESHRIPLTVIVYPDTRDVSPRSPVRALAGEVERQLDAMKIDRVPPVDQEFNVFAGRERDLWVAPSDPHGNAVVSEILAQAAARNILDKKFLQR